MKRVAAIVAGFVLSSCSPWLKADSGSALIGGERYRVAYLAVAPGVYDLQAFKMRWAEGQAADDRQFTVDATGQVASSLCRGPVELVSVERVGGPPLYEARWRCR
jgi:hypothetical protein